MKKIFSIVLFASLMLTASAQNGWQKPDVQGQNEDDSKPKRGLFDKNKGPIDAKYLEGAVEEVDGKVCWTKTYSVPGKSATEIYDIMLDFMQKFVKEPQQTDKSLIAVVNKDFHQIGVRLRENLVFQNSLLSLDQTIFNYNLFVTCKNGECEVRMLNLSYHYEKDRPTEALFTAEEMIADKVALNKKKTGFTKGGTRKFRMKTIDRKDVVFEQIAEALK